MTIKQVIGKAIYNSVAKHMPLSDSRFSFGSKKVRAFCGNLILEHCGKNVNIEKGAQFSSAISLGDNSGIGVYAQISSDVIIGKDVMMGPYCLIYTSNHRMDKLDQPMWKQGFTLPKAVIIEDDYNGELRYSTHPVPCVQNYGIENTVYLGSFSKVLLPSVRISYMVLPDSLMSRYIKIKSSTNQTASKAEQLALAKYIETGKIDAHLRKARRIYLEKSRIMLENIKKYFGDSVRVLFNETSLHISLFTDRNIDRANADKMLKRNSVGIMPYKTANNEFRLSFSGIPQEKIADGIELLADIIGKTM